VSRILSLCIAFAEWQKENGLAPTQLKAYWNLSGIERKTSDPSLPVLRFNPSYDLSKEAANISAFLGGIDDEIDIDNDTANKIARNLWLDTIISDSSGDSSPIVTFSQYMDLLQSQSTWFIYEFATDKNG
jgi:hypothetical protein